MISVIVPVYIIDKELARMTKKCLKGFKDKDIELIIIDNGSPIQLDYKCDILVRNKTNRGNGVGWNQGLKLAKGSHLLLADNDTEFDKSWKDLSKMTDGAIAFPHLFQGGKYRTSATGCFWMMDRITYELVGDISEEYGLGYYEDTDYFMRAMQKGIKLLYDEKIKVIHHGASTGKKLNLDVKKNEEFYKKKFNNNFPYLTNINQ